MAALAVQIVPTADAAPDVPVPVWVRGEGGERIGVRVTNTNSTAWFEALGVGNAG